LYSPYLRLSVEGPQTGIAQIEVQVKRNPMKTLAQIISRVNNLGLDVSSDPEVYHRRTSSYLKWRARVSNLSIVLIEASMCVK
jgi:hypothetical protein